MSCIKQKHTEIQRLSTILGFKVPLDGFLMMMLQRPAIDIIKLDKRLMKDYNYTGSMNDFIKTQFGTEALEIINKDLDYDFQ